MKFGSGEAHENVLSRGVKCSLNPVLINIIYKFVKLNWLIDYILEEWKRKWKITRGIFRETEFIQIFSKMFYVH